MKIYAFINSGKGTDWVVGCAIAEDGTGCGGHVSSSDAWSRHDMGATEANAMHWHDYAKMYPDGFEVEWVDDARPGPNEHQGLAAAYKLNQEKAEAAKEQEA